MAENFHLESSTPNGRRGVLSTPHGDLPTPFFMPIATRAAVKTLSTVDIERLGSPILLSNTFHLMLKPGEEVIESSGGLHRFMGWNGAILTDSGGYQVFSLADRRTVVEEGVAFASPIDGTKHVLTPERSIGIQRTLGSDIVMCFDELVALPNEREVISDAVDRTERWAKRCKEAFESSRESSRNPGALLFGIIQGGTDAGLRQRSAEGLVGIGFDGYAIGGLSVGEPFEDACATLDRLMPILPEDKPRYFMGGAQPHQIVEYVRRGIDMFDCVLPTRNARHGHLYRWVHSDLSRPDFYEVVNIMNAKWKGDQCPLLDGKRPDSASIASAESRKQFLEEELSRFSLGYLHHLFDVKEMLAYRLATINNLAFYLDLFDVIRAGSKS
jgi:queuine tRNA-ribosyltransferase